MKITEKLLQKIIQEEVAAFLKEDWDEDMPPEDDDGYIPDASGLGPLAQKPRYRPKYAPDKATQKTAAHGDDGNHPYMKKLSDEEFEAMRAKSAEEQSAIDRAADASSSAGMIDKIADINRVLSNIQLRLKRLEKS